MIHIDQKEYLAVLERLLNVTSPSGNTEAIIQLMEKYLHDANISTYKNNKGGLIATLPGKITDKQRMLTAHVDTLGAMVKEIKPNGRLRLDLIGGFTYNSIEGENCMIETSSGKTYTGTILLHQASVHVYKEARTLERNQANMEVRLDEIVKNQEDVKNLGISVGDFVSFYPRVEITPSGFIKSRHLDDKASAAILLLLMKQIKENNIELPYTTNFLLSNNEEIGYGGNSNIPVETVEYMAVDMGAMGDGQATDEYTVSICVKDASGPYHYALRKHLVQLADKKEIPYQLDIYPYYGSDASAAIRSGHDIKHALIGPGIDSSHAYERTHFTSVEATGKLIYHYLLSELV
ncbi:M42 family metallopeptidase [Niallia sp. JL1B1071]|uniref:M42 family metallopeptidase n=1 Tax=Niallia tiangongensis TaxID=3237105 RepID=UPI0037DCC50C